MDKEEIVRDVVCGMEKPKSLMGFTSVFDSKTYYFCSQQDKEMFDAHPDRWVPKEGDENEKVD